MGICNVTRDSFSDGGIAFNTKDAIKHIKTIVKAGATIIDIGATMGAAVASSAITSVGVHAIHTRAPICAFVVNAIIDIRFAIITAIARLAIALITVQQIFAGALPIAGLTDAIIYIT